MYMNFHIFFSFMQYNFFNILLLYSIQAFTDSLQNSFFGLSLFILIYHSFIYSFIKPETLFLVSWIYSSLYGFLFCFFIFFYFSSVCRISTLMTLCPKGPFLGIVPLCFQRILKRDASNFVVYYNHLIVLKNR